jgi:hypothetical protein
VNVKGTIEVTVLHRVRHLFRLLLAVSVLAVALVGMSAPVSALPGEDCSNPKGDGPAPRLLSGSIASDGTSATVQNFSDGCTFQVGLASYQVFDLRSDGTPLLSSQRLYDHEIVTLGPGQSVTLHVDVPDCLAQVDLFYGDLIRSFANGERYGSRLLNFVVVGSGVCVPPTPPATGRMTGGGSLFTAGGMRVTHGFQIRCDANDTRQNLQINWGKGNKFHLLDMTQAVCSDDPNIIPTPPTAPIDTYEGWGVGRYNGVDGATVHFIFKDAGEPGVSDTGWIEVKDAKGKVVLTVDTTTLKKGNHQAHKK